MNLSADEIAIVQKQVDQSSINIESLRDDVLDHLCCVIEAKLEHGEIFGNALKQALHELAPDGLDEIQNETVFLLNSTKIILMKKVMYLIGLMSAIAMSSGWMFKILRFSFGDDLITYGTGGFVLLYLPMLMVNQYKLIMTAALSEKLRMILGFLSAIAISTGITFKILHLNGADILLVSGTFIFCVGFLPLMFFNQYKKSVS